MNPQYGYYNYPSIDEEPIKTRRVYGTQPRINKEPDLEFKEIRTLTDYSGYIPKQKFALDNAKDIITRINEVKADIERYNQWGIDEISGAGRPTSVVNFYKIAINCERELEHLYNLL